MKRSYNDFRRKPSLHDDDSDSSTRMNPVVIELEGGNSRNNYDGYRRKDDARLLNLLLLAVMEKKNHSRDDDTVGAKLRYRNLVLNNNSAGASTTTSQTPSVTNTRGMDSADRIPSDDRTLSPLSDCTLPKNTSILPNGRPLMAPPRLPTHLISRKARLVTTNSTKLGIMLPYEVRCTKTTRKRHKKTSDQFPWARVQEQPQSHSLDRNTKIHTLRPQVHVMRNAMRNPHVQYIQCVY